MEDLGEIVGEFLMEKLTVTRQAGVHSVGQAAQGQFAGLKAARPHAFVFRVRIHDARGHHDGDGHHGHAPEGQQQGRTAPGMSLEARGFHGWAFSRVA